MLSWKQLENAVISIACLKWGCSGRPEHIGGVDFDSVLRPSPEELVLIEVTEKNNLKKIREDITKIGSIRLQNAALGIVCRSYIVTKFTPTSSMIETGTLNKVSILSYTEFFSHFFDYNSYFNLRSAQVFGSAINPLTGLPDSNPYIPVDYNSDDEDKSFSASGVAKKLLNGEKIILIGDYGTGKSRCIQEVFELLKPDISQHYAILAINLRDHWGASTAAGIVAGHLEDMGFSSMIDNVMKMVNAGGVILLLDGVDEVGAQAFGVKKENRKSLRRSALSGVRKLVEKNKGGILITSRSHYFDDDDEMLNSIGVNTEKSLIFRCANEFTEIQSTEYLKKIGIDKKVPAWLPRKPLVFQVISTIDNEIAQKFLGDEAGEIDFWGKFLDSICTREAKIHGSIDPQAVKSILIALAERSRLGNEYLGRLSIRDVREVYEEVTGESPDEAGEQMLMRLCTLGRVGPTSPERQFVDEYVVDGLRAEGLIFSIDQQNRDISFLAWKQPLRRLGWNLLLESLINFKKERAYRSAVGFLTNGQNHQALAEVISALLFTEGPDIDGHSYYISDSEIHCLVIGNRYIDSIKIENSFIDNLMLQPEDTKRISNVEIDDCLIEDVYGVSSESGIPPWITKTAIRRFDNTSNIARIKESRLTPPQILFLAIIHKIFFQPGSGRKEQALRKGGFGLEYNPKLMSSIIAILMREGVVDRKIGDDGYIYHPIRKYSRRMAEMKSQLSLSHDPLWLEISSL